MKVGDLMYVGEKAQVLGYPPCGIIIEMVGGRARIAFHDGQCQIFHPKWLITDKK